MAAASTMHVRAPSRATGSGIRRALSIAAAVLVVVGGTTIALSMRGRHAGAAGAGWGIVSVKGGATLGAESVTAIESDLRSLPPGEWLETGAAGEAKLRAPRLGTVRLAPRSRVRLIEATASRQRLELARGSIEVNVTAPPRVFIVETPTAAAVDLGCHYTLSVEDDGSSMLVVLLGRVALERGERVSVVPRDAQCRTRPDQGSGAPGPGLPHFADCSQAFTASIMVLEADPTADTAIEMLLEEARPRDTLTLWHLLQRVSGARRETVLDRLLELVPLPEGASRQGILLLDRHELEALWEPMYRRWYGYDS
jgi:hypothetical protein